MSLIGIGIAAALAAVAAVGGALAVRRRRSGHSKAALTSAEVAANAAAEHAAAAAQDASLRPPLALGDVVQVGMDARWSEGALLARDHQGIRLIVLLSQSGAEKEVTVAFAPPERAILWLTPHEDEPQLPPPSRIEVEGQLLERTMLLPLTISSEGDAPALSGDATVAVYQGAVGEAAVILHHPRHSVLWYGRRVANGDWERLANVDG